VTQPADDGGKAKRAERLAARLRDNLARRKAQARSRRTGGEDPRSGLSAEDAKVAKAPESDDDVSRG
jgi:hypothetical protein